MSQRAGSGSFGAAIWAGAPQGFLVEGWLQAKWVEGSGRRRRKGKEGGINYAPILASRRVHGLLPTASLFLPALDERKPESIPRPALSKNLTIIPFIVYTASNSCSLWEDGLLSFFI